MKVKINIVTDYICPWCYIGKKRLQEAMNALVEKYSFEINFIPFQLNPQMPEEGLNRKEYRSKKFGSWEKSQQLDAQVVAAGKAEGLEFNYNVVEVTPNTLKAHLLTQWARKLDKHQEISQEIFKAYFTEGKNIGTDQVLLEIAQGVGLNTEAADFMNYQAAENLQLLTTTEKEYKARGVNSVPLFIIANQAVSGAQSKEVLIKFITENANAHEVN